MSPSSILSGFWSDCSRTYHKQIGILPIVEVSGWSTL